jgi:GNAT superfamily N-acetyltransferase
MLETCEVQTRRDRQDFVRLPYQIYRQDSAWVPPLELERLEFLDRRKHPFYLHGVATAFLVRRSGIPVGRILVSDDPNYHAVHTDNAGAFGMFEAIDDPAVAEALLLAAENWLRSHGRSLMRGPMDFSLNYQCGLLVDGFDTPPRVMMNHNPAYYAPLLESCGYQKGKDLLAYWLDMRTDLAGRWRRRVEMVSKRGIVVRSARPGKLRQEFLECAHIYNAAWKPNWSATQMTASEFDFIAKSIAQFAVPQMLLAAEIEGRPVAFSLTLPDINEAIRLAGGKLFRWGLPIGLLRLLRGLRRIKTGRLVALGILEEYRRRGIAELLILKTFDYARDQLGYTGAELSWTLEDNDAINRVCLTAGGVPYKRYRVYEKAIA